MQKNTNWKYLFLISTLIYVVIVVFSLVTGTPSKFAVPIDPDGHICGQGESKDYPYIYFAVPFENYLHRTLCLSECPRVHGIQSTPSLVSKVGSSTKLACLTNSLVTTCEQTISSNDQTNHDSDVFFYDSREALGRVCVPTRENYFNAVQPALPTNYQIPSIIYEIRSQFFFILLFSAITGVLCILNLILKQAQSEGFQQIIFPLLSVVSFFTAGFIFFKKIFARLFGSEEKIHLSNYSTSEQFNEILLTMTINPIIESVLCLLCFYASLMSIIQLIKLIKTTLQVTFFEYAHKIVSNIEITSLQFALLVLSLITLSFNFFVFEHVLAIGSSLEAEEMKASLPFERFKPTNLAIFLFLITLFISLWNIAFFVKAIEFLSMLCSRNHIHKSKRQSLNDFTNLNLTWDEVRENLLELIQSDLGTIAKHSMISLLFSFIRQNILEPIHQIACEQTEQRNSIYTKINSYYEGSFIQLHEPYLLTFNTISGTESQSNNQQRRVHSGSIQNTSHQQQIQKSCIQQYLEYFEIVEVEYQDFACMLPSIMYFYLQTDPSTSTREYPMFTVFLASLLIASYCLTLHKASFSHILIYCHDTSQQQQQQSTNTRDDLLTRRQLVLLQSTFNMFKDLESQPRKIPIPTPPIPPTPPTPPRVPHVIQEHRQITKAFKMLYNNIKESSIKASNNLIKKLFDNKVFHKENLKQILSIDNFCEMEEIPEDVKLELMEIEENLNLLNPDRKAKLEDVILEAEMQILTKSLKSEEQYIKDLETTKEAKKLCEEAVTDTSNDQTSPDYVYPFAMLAINDYYESKNIPLTMEKPSEQLNEASYAENNSNDLTLNRKSVTDIKDELSRDCKELLQMQMIQTGNADKGYHIISGEYKEAALLRNEYGVSGPVVGKLNDGLSSQEKNKRIRQMEEEMYKKNKSKIAKEIRDIIKQCTNSEVSIGKFEFENMDGIVQFSSAVRVDDADDDFSSRLTKKLVDSTNFSNTVVQNYPALKDYKLTMDLFKPQFNAYWYREILQVDYGFCGQINGVPQPYYYPFGWAGFALNVDRFLESENKNWLNNDTEEGTWIVLYLNSKTIPLQLLLNGQNQQKFDYKIEKGNTPIKDNNSHISLPEEDTCRFTQQKIKFKEYEGLVFTDTVPHPDTHNINIITVRNQDYYFVFQCRVNPVDVFSPTSKKNLYVVRKEKATVSIRPYRFVMKDINDQNILYK